MRCEHEHARRQKRGANPGEPSQRTVTSARTSVPYGLQRPESGLPAASARRCARARVPRSRRHRQRRPRSETPSGAHERRPAGERGERDERRDEDHKPERRGEARRPRWLMRASRLRASARESPGASASAATSETISAGAPTVAISAAPASGRARVDACSRASRRSRRTGART